MHGYLLQLVEVAKMRRAGGASPFSAQLVLCMKFHDEHNVSPFHSPNNYTYIDDKTFSF